MTHYTSELILRPCCDNGVCNGQMLFEHKYTKENKKEYKDDDDDDDDIKFDIYFSLHIALNMIFYWNQKKIDFLF